MIGFSIWGGLRGNGWARPRHTHASSDHIILDRPGQTSRERIRLDWPEQFEFPLAYHSRGTTYVRYQTCVVRHHQYSYIYIYIRLFVTSVELAHVLQITLKVQTREPHHERQTGKPFRKAPASVEWPHLKHRVQVWVVC